MKSAYSYTVYKNEKNHLPLHVVNIVSPLLVGVAVFSTAADALEHINREKKRLARYGLTLEYDYSLDAPCGFVNAYKNAGALFSKVDSKRMYIAAE